LFSTTTLLFIRTLAALGAVCLAAWVLLRWGLPRWLPHLSGADADDGPIEVLSRHALGPKRAILLIRVAERTLVVGDTEAGLSRLGELPEKSSPDPQPAEPSIEWSTGASLPIIELGEAGLGEPVERAESRADQARQRPSPVSIVEPVHPSEVQTTEETITRISEDV
jgi:flagellar biogenesis protein FliO